MRNWSSALRKRRALLGQLHGPSDWLTFLQAFFFALTVPALVRLPLPRLKECLPSKTVRQPADPAQMDQIARPVEIALSVGRPLIRSGCLTRGITLYYFLSRAGFDIRLCFGMGNVEGEFAGHCWLVQAGEPLMEPSDPRPLFQGFYYIP